MKKERRKFSAQFKTKVILETIMERRIILQKSKVKFLLFTFAVFSRINFVSAQTKQVDLNGKEALVFSGTGNGDLRNVMNLDIALDSGLIVASMERVTTENQLRKTLNDKKSLLKNANKINPSPLALQ